MKIILNNNSLFKSLRPFNDIGFVPTMGSIHEGHLSLIDRSNRACKKTIVSIFVNPKQFNNKKDFKSYPTNIKEDIKILKKTKKVDFLYIPKFKDVYNNNKKSNKPLKKTETHNQFQNNRNMKKAKKCWKIKKNVWEWSARSICSMFFMFAACFSCFSDTNTHTHTQTQTHTDTNTHVIPSG